MIQRLSEVWPLLERIAREEGVLRIGASGLADEHWSLYDEWIRNGHHASMQYLAKNRDIRLDPSRRFPWARSIVVILVPYASERPQAPEGALSNHIARYALGDDYHDVLDRILRKFEEALTSVVPDGKTWRYVDTGPLSDRAAGAQAAVSIASFKFPLASPGNRFQVVQGAVSYACDLGTGTLWRYWNYPVQAAQPNAATLPGMAGPNAARLATYVTGCAFRYVEGVTERSGLLELQLTLEDEGEKVTLYHTVHVNNVP